MNISSRLRCFSVVLGMCLVLVACGGDGDELSTEPSTAPELPSTSDSGSNPNVPAPSLWTCGDQDQILAMINMARAVPRVCEAGGEMLPAVAALRWNTRLEDAAHAHSMDMAQHEFLDHTGSDGSRLPDRVTRAGYAWLEVAENIAHGYPSVSTVVDAWLASLGHCRNIMSNAMEDFGASCVTNGAGNYWTAVFARQN